MNIEELGKSTSASSRTQDKFATYEQVKDLQGDLSSVKGLLLSRQQFPPAPTITPLKGTVSIPAWQLSEPTANASDGDSQPTISNGEESL